MASSSKRNAVAKEKVCKDRPQRADQSHSSSGGCDMHYLESGDFADIRVVFMEGDDEIQSFNCHKVILARSVWFKVQMKENLVEYNAGVEGHASQSIDRDDAKMHLPYIVVFHPAGSRAIKIVLTFVYGRDISFKPVPGYGDLFPYMLAFKIALDFEVTGMEDDVSYALGSFLSDVLAQICDQRLAAPATEKKDGRTKIQKIVRKNNLVGAFLQAIELADMIRVDEPTAGKQGLHLRPYYMLVDFFVAGKEVLLREPEVKVFIDQEVVPDFPRQVMLREIRGAPRSEWMEKLMPAPPDSMSGRKGVCCVGGCKQSLKNAGAAALVNPKSKVVSYEQLCCSKCADKEDNISPQMGVSVTKWSVFDPPKDQ